MFTNIEMNGVLRFDCGEGKQQSSPSHTIVAIRRINDMEDFHGKPYADDKPVRYDSTLITGIGVYLLGFACGAGTYAFVAWLF